jgi:hypothetical protein
MSFLKVLNILVTAAGFIVPLALLLEAEELPGEEKKKAVLAQLKAQLDSVGLKFPEWLQKFIDPILGLLIDAVVFWLNKTGFFEHGGESSKG